MTADVKDPALTPEQRALLSGASQVDGLIEPVITHDDAGNPIEATADAAPPPDPLQRNRDLLNLGLTMLAPVAPFLGECYPPDTVAAIAAAFTAVEVKHGWDVQRFISEEFVLAAVAIPPTLKAIIMGRAYIAAMNEKARAQIQQNSDTMRTVDNGNS